MTKNIIEIKEIQLKNQTLKVKTDLVSLSKLMEKYVDSLEEVVGKELREEDKLKFDYIIKANKQCCELSDIISLLNKF